MDYPATFFGNKMYHLLSDKSESRKFKPPRDSMINPRAF